MTYVLINPLQQVLTFAEYKKALEKADAYEKKQTFPEEVVKPKRGRPVGTIKIPKPETPPEPKKRGRPPKVKAPVVKAPVGRPTKEPEDYYDVGLDGNRLDPSLVGTGWYKDPEQIAKLLNAFFKDAKYIRYKNGMFEVYADGVWAIRRPINKKNLPNPEEVVNDIGDMVMGYVDDMGTQYHFSEDRQDADSRKKQFKKLIKQYLINRFT